MPTWFFAFSVLGILFAQRISQKYISNLRTQNYRRLIFLFFAGAIAIVGARIDLILILNGLLIASLELFDHWICHLRKKAVLQRGIRFLDELILGVRSGRTLRIAAEEIFERTSVDSDLEMLHEYYRNYFLNEQKVNEKGLSSPQYIFKELGKISKSKGSAIEQLILFRQQIKVVESLRHKSSQASFQSRLQALIMLFIFCALSISMISFFGIAKMQPFIAMGAIPLSIGLFIVYRMDRWFQWKI